MSIRLICSSTTFSRNREPRQLATWFPTDSDISLASGALMTWNLNRLETKLDFWRKGEGKVSRLNGHGPELFPFLSFKTHLAGTKNDQQLDQILWLFYAVLSLFVSGISLASLPKHPGMLPSIFSIDQFLRALFLGFWFQDLTNKKQKADELQKPLLNVIWRCFDKIAEVLA